MLRESGLAFDEVLIPLDEPNTRTELLRLSPSGRVPALKDGELIVWDSLAIGEYLAERCPEKQLWPADPAARAVARSIAAEMHSGFAALRDHLPMNIRSTFPNRGVVPEVQSDINRITALWREQRRKMAPEAGRILFGHFTVTDAMFAPVVSRFPDLIGSISMNLCRATPTPSGRCHPIKNGRKRRSTSR
ncbi:MAG: glutathione S-transferase [Aliidongia sp.]